MSTSPRTYARYWTTDQRRSEVLQPTFSLAPLGLQARKHLPKEIDRSGQDDDIILSARGAGPGTGEKPLDRRPNRFTVKCARNKGLELGMG